MESSVDGLVRDEYIEPQERVGTLIPFHQKHDARKISDHFDLCVHRRTDTMAMSPDSKLLFEQVPTDRHRLQSVGLDRNALRVCTVRVVFSWIRYSAHALVSE